MICNKCGSQLPDDSIFCTECGAKLETEETANTVHTDDEPTSILPHLEEVIAENDETLSLTQEQVELLNDEPAEILNVSEEETLPEPELQYEEKTEVIPITEPTYEEKTDVITLPESEPLHEDVTEVIPAPEPEPLPPPMHTADEKPAEAPVETPVVNNGYDDNSDTMKIPVQNDPFGKETEQFAPKNDNNDIGENAPISPPQDVILPQPPVMPREPEPIPFPNSAPAPEPMPAPMPAQDEAKDKPQKKVSGGRIFGASLVSLLALVFLLLFSFLLSVKVGLNGNIVKKRAEKLNARTTLTAEFDGKELAKTFYDSMGFRTATRGAADEEGFKNFMLRTDSPDFREYIGTVAEGYLDYIIDGYKHDPSVISEDFVNDFIKSNKKSIVREFDYDLSDSDYDLIQHNLDKDDFTETMDIKEWNKNAGFDLGDLSFAFSYITIGIVAALILLILIWIAAIVDKRAKHVTGFFGFIFSFTGCISILSGITVIIGSAIAFTSTHNVLFYLSENLLMPFSVMLCIIGAGEFFIGFIFRKANKRIKKKARKAALAASSQTNN